MFEHYKYTINCLCNYIYCVNYNVFFGKFIQLLVTV